MIKTALFGFVIGGEILTLVKQTGAVAQVVLLILLIFSLLSWSIILSKWASLRRARTKNGRGLRAVRKAPRLQDVAPASQQLKPAPPGVGFSSAHEEVPRP